MKRIEKLKLSLIAITMFFAVSNVKAQNFFELLPTADFEEYEYGFTVDDNNNVYIATQNQILKLQNGSQNWVGVLDWFGAYHSIWSDKNRIFVSSLNIIKYSENEGETWNEIVTPNESNYLYINDSTIYSCSIYDSNCGIWRSKDFGRTWQLLLSMDKKNINFFPYIIREYGEETIYAAVYSPQPAGNGVSGLLCSNDDGNNWHFVQPFEQINVIFDMNDNGDLYVLDYTENILYIGRNGSEYYDTISFNYSVKDMIVHNDIIFLRLSNSLLVSRNDGITWEEIEYPSAKNSSSLSIAINGQEYLYIYIPHEGGANIYKSKNTVLGIEEAPDIIDDVSIYPNPVKDIINIQSSIEGLFEIMIYDMYGHLIMHKDKKIDSSINIENLKQGMYFIHVLNEKANINTVLKFVKK